MVVIPSLLSVVLPHRRYPGSEPSAGGKAGSQGCSEERAEPLERPQIIVASTAPWKGASKPRTLLPAEGIQSRRTARAPPGRDAMMRHVALVPGVPLRFTPGYQLASLRLAILPANLWVKLRAESGTLPTKSSVRTSEACALAWNAHNPHGDDRFRLGLNTDRPTPGHAILPANLWVKLRRFPPSPRRFATPTPPSASQTRRPAPSAPLLMLTKDTSTESRPVRQVEVEAWAVWLESARQREC